MLNRAAVAQYRIVQSVAMSAQAMSARGRPHPHLVKLSKFLVYVCRHGATSWGLQADPDGWLAIDDVHSLKPLRSAPGRAGIIQIVEVACEGRLQLDHSGTHIRAVQGHSLAIRDDSFRRVDLGTPGIPRWLIHGTDEEAFLKIRREGISPMTRQHVHLATTVDVVHDYSTVLIYVDKNEILRLGMELLLSGPAAGPGAVRVGHSGVVLCRSVIPPSCFKSAWHIAKEIDLLHHTSDDWVEAEEVETTTRWKQIRLGEWTHEYSVWLYSSDEDKKLFPISEPPDFSAVLPKRVFLRDLSAWRRSLHEFQEWLRGRDAHAGGGDHERRHDPPAARGTVASSSSYRGRTTYPDKKRPRTSSRSEREEGYSGQSWGSDWQGWSWDSDRQSWDWQSSDSASWATSRWR